MHPILHRDSAVHVTPWPQPARLSLWP